MSPSWFPVGTTDPLVSSGTQRTSSARHVRSLESLLFWLFAAVTTAHAWTSAKLAEVARGRMQDRPSVQLYKLIRAQQHDLWLAMAAIAAVIVGGYAGLPCWPKLAGAAVLLWLTRRAHLRLQILRSNV